MARCESRAGPQLMQNRRSFPLAAARCVVMAASAVSIGIVLASAFSGCSIDFFKPESYAFIKEAMAATPVPEESPAIVGTPSSRPTPSTLVASSVPSQPKQPAQLVPLPPPPPGAVNPSRQPRIVPASDVPGGFSLPGFASKQEEQPAPPPAAVPADEDEDAEPSTPAVDRVVASVDGDPITMRAVKDFASQHGQPIDSDDFASSETAKTAVKALIGEKLLEQEVKKYDDKVDDAQVDRYIAQLRMDKHMSDAEFRAQLQASGMSYDELRKRARLDLEKAMMIEQEVRAKIDVPDADIKAYYVAH